MTTSTIHPSIVDLLRFTRTHQHHHEALMRATGGHFNLFQVLGIGHYEVRTHSPILAELLNPKGSHGQGDVFLKLFLKMPGIDETGFNAKSTLVETERYIGPKTETSGGQIDIVVEDGIRRRILIENKIYAGDQQNQLLRYYNYDKGADLIYLTRFGSEASDYSIGDLDREAYHRISYQIEIREWLLNCRKEASNLPGLREMLSQYIALIEELTHQSTTLQMNQKLIDEILKTEESYQAFLMLREAESAVHYRLIDQLDTELQDYSNIIGLEKIGSARDINARDGNINFRSDSLTQNNLVIGFHFESSGYNGMCFGFAKINPDLPSPLSEKLLAAFTEKFPSEAPTPWWPAWTYFEPPYRYWRQEAFEGIRSGQLAANLKEKLRVLSQIANEICGDAAVPIQNSLPLVS